MPTYHSENVTPSAAKAIILGVSTLFYPHGVILLSISKCGLIFFDWRDEAVMLFTENQHLNPDFQAVLRLQEAARDCVRFNKPFKPSFERFRLLPALSRLFSVKHALKTGVATQSSLAIALVKHDGERYVNSTLDDCMHFTDVPTDQLQNFHNFLETREGVDLVRKIIPSPDDLYFEEIPGGVVGFRLPRRLFLGDCSSYLVWATIQKFPKKATMTEIWVQYRGVRPAQALVLAPEDDIEKLNLMNPWSAFFTEGVQFPNRLRKMKLFIQYAFMSAGHVRNAFPPVTTATFEQIYEGLTIINNIYSNRGIDASDTYRPRPREAFRGDDRPDTTPETETETERAPSPLDTPSVVPTEAQIILTNNLISRGQQLIRDAGSVQTSSRVGAGAKRGNQETEDLLGTLSKKSKYEEHVKELHDHLEKLESKLQKIDRNIDDKTSGWTVDDFREFLKGKKEMEK
ncbi:hypothetical protein P154DRAFT_540987 [Amniculicola lignicola CBS 123094]|uniref:Uncharacterized protein n=1 Tax=Amniculicola lignicola CBS 123094 TaxID=1392246 RepID=A0A6A5VUP4_9PLEO|nr:hypothetical protein P154DRAFT_540987 [Amniculicola lignicola CBS 123094]